MIASGCNSDVDEPVPAATNSPAPAKTVKPAAETAPGQPAVTAPALKPIAFDQFSSLIEPGTGCSFESAAQDLLFVATAGAASDAQAAEAVVDAGDGPQVLTASETGGYEALLDGARFTGKDGLVVAVRRDSSVSQSTGMETTAWPGSMEISVGDGPVTTYSGGQYSCGA